MNKWLAISIGIWLLLFCKGLYLGYTVDEACPVWLVLAVIAMATGYCLGFGVHLLIKHFG